ncbi:hypothetical protein [Spirosoma flavum]|uniref:Uncharacterized protein n=1 Tax=Spirosoma flavum TaxID=2048557 RepID=A0ABW6AJV1_9BACT
MGTVCIVNATSYKGVGVVVMKLMLAEKSEKIVLHRSSATILTGILRTTDKIIKNGQ